MPSYKFTYFQLKGKGEVSRLVLTAAGVDWEDCRPSFEEWAKLKPTTPFGQLPMLQFEGNTLCQGAAIAGFIARKHGLAGKTDVDAAKCDMINGCLDDMSKNLVALHFEPDEAKKAEMKKKHAEETIPSHVANLEKMAAGNGYMVGSSLTWADLSLYHNLEWPKYEGITPDLSKAPKLQAVVKNVSLHDKIKAYLAKRPESTF